MIATRPDIEPNGLYSQAQAAAALMVDRHTIGRYVRQGILTPAIRRSTGRKVYSGRQLIRIWERTY